MRRSTITTLAVLTISTAMLSAGVASADAPHRPGPGSDSEALFWPTHQLKAGPTYSQALAFGVTSISPTNAWMVGEQLTRGEDKPLIEHWNGTSWSVVPSPTPSGALYSRLKSVNAVSANNIWAVGDLRLRGGGSRTLIEHWNGTSWHRVPSPNPVHSGFGNALYSVSAVSATDVWAVGYYDPSGPDIEHSLAVHWNGGSWSVVRTPNRAGVNRGFLGVDLPTSASGWAVGATDTRDGSFRSLGEHWNGRRWQAAPIVGPGAGSALYGVSIVAPGNVWAAGFWGRFGHARQPLLMHRSDGQWRQVKVPGLYKPGGFTALSADGPDDIWAVGSLGNVALLVHWDGSHWSTYHGIGSRGVVMRGVAASGPGQTWAVGYRLSHGVEPVQERWNGHVWTR